MRSVNVPPTSTPMRFMQLLCLLQEYRLADAIEPFWVAVVPPQHAPDPNEDPGYGEVREDIERWSRIWVHARDQRTDIDQKADRWNDTVQEPGKLLRVPPAHECN